MIAIKSPHISQLEKSMLCDAECIRQDRKVEFKNFFFEVERIEDAGGRVFVRERTCRLIGTLYYDGEGIWIHELSCGHEPETLDKEPPSYCPECGARVER